MRTVVLGGRGPEVSEFCLGTDAFGTRIGQQASYDLLDTFAEAGGTFVDTANVYMHWYPGGSGGDSERVIGGWLASRSRPDICVATKVGAPYDATSTGPGGGGLRAAEIVRECEGSLRRLGIDRIGVYYAHADIRDAPIEETMEAFAQLVQAGKIASIGLSNWYAWRMAEARLLGELRGWAVPVAAELRFSYLRPAPGRAATLYPQLVLADDGLDFCRRHMITPVAYAVQLGGLYARAHSPVPEEYAGADTDARLAVLQAVSAEIGALPHQVVLGWLRRTGPSVPDGLLSASSPESGSAPAPTGRPWAGIVPIVAASNQRHLQECLAAANLALDDDQVRRLDHAGCAEDS